jgi:hypothetical protein
MKPNHPAVNDVTAWSGPPPTPAQQEFGYVPQPSGLPAWRHEFPHRSSSVLPELSEPAVVPAPGYASTPVPPSRPAADPAERSGQSV